MELLAVFFVVGRLTGLYGSTADSRGNRLLKQKCHFVGVCATPLPPFVKVVWTSRNTPPTPVQSNNWFRGHFQVGKKGQYAGRKQGKSVSETTDPFY